MGGRLARKLALTLAALVVALGAAELGARVLRAEPWSRAAALRELDELRARVVEALPRAGGEEATPSKERRTPPLELVPHPYVAFDLSRGARQVEQDLARLARGEEEPFAILLTGGSVAGIFGGAGMQRLVARLEADERFAGRRIVPLNYGRAAFKQPQQAAFLVHLLGLGIEPDLVLNLDGFNELAVAATNARMGAHPGYPSMAQWRHVATAPDSGEGAVEALTELLASRAALLEGVERAQASPLLSSALLGPLVLRGAAAREARYAAALAAYVARAPSDEDEAALLRGPAFDADWEATLALCVREWVEGSRSMHALCARRGVAYLHALQPTLLDPGSKPATPGELEGAKARREWVESVRDGYPRLREAGAALAAEGVFFLDASRVFAEVEEELYYDACHFAPRGNELLADAIADALLASDIAR